MADYPSDLRYTNEHEWIRTDGATWRMGITKFAATQLGDVVLVELPRPGATIEQGGAFGSIESVKSVSELYAPVSGKVVAVNTALNDSPELVNSDPYGEGWMIEIEPSDRAQADGLLAADAYTKLVAEAG